EVATPGFLAEYDSRPNRVFLDYLAFPREVIPTVWAAQRGAVLVGVVAVSAIAAIVWRVVRRRVAADRPESWQARLTALLVVGLALFAGARSTLAPRGANI